MLVERHHYDAAIEPESPTALFRAACELRNRIQRAELAGDTAAADADRARLDDVRRRAHAASIDVEAAGEELVKRRHELRDLVRADRRKKRFRWLQGGVGSAERIWTEPATAQQPLDERRERIVHRIYELEEALIAADALGDFPPLAPNNVEKWW